MKAQPMQSDTDDLIMKFRAFFGTTKENRIPLCVSVVNFLV